MNSCETGVSSHVACELCRKVASENNKHKYKEISQWRTHEKGGGFGARDTADLAGDTSSNLQRQRATSLVLEARLTGQDLIGAAARRLAK